MREGEPTSSCKDARNSVDHSRLISNKGRDDMLLLSLIQGLRIIDIHIILLPLLLQSHANYSHTLSTAAYILQCMAECESSLQLHASCPRMYREPLTPNGVIAAGVDGDDDAAAAAADCTCKGCT